MLSKIFSSLSSDVKGLSLPGKKEDSMEPFELSSTAPVLYFNYNHNSVSKKKLANKCTCTKKFRNFQLE